MDSAPVVSLIVPVYNTGFRLRGCFDSLLAQTLKPLEIIIVNDGSTDDSGDICREYAEKYPDKIRLIEAPNGGSSVARNRGLDAARGEWVGFCDSDDVLLPDFCSYLLERAAAADAQISSCALARGQNGEGDVSMNIPVKTEVVWEREQILRDLIHPLLRLGDPASVIVRGYVTLSLFRRDLIEQNHLRFVPGMTVTEDEVFYFEYLQLIRRAALSPRVLYYYLETPDSACARFLRKRRKLFTTQEKFWGMRWQQKYRIFTQYHLAEHFPGVLPVLWLTTRYHELQMLNCRNDISFREKFRTIGELRRKILAEPELAVCRNTLGALPRFLKIFYHILNAGTFFVWFFCKGIAIRKDLLPS